MSVAGYLEKLTTEFIEEEMPDKPGIALRSLEDKSWEMDIDEVSAEILVAARLKLRITGLGKRKVRISVSKVKQ